ncbi:cobyrinate a,c-diamide synthase [Noviherbaspirillum galbum]|uniref:Cobyrinate a,c-diamide synthase n=1 Tax=Noviherbaspirillum galbum TaxID=2709383 RepID=A0A6B3SMY2_9BURK|nr:cobyrinate a,c-diamide synthase [Noviherbaspirillum galbum]NEX62081.1 cobyrinate a,c-diamide synthase [Noviherbaspirillum galbum]
MAKIMLVSAIASGQGKTTLTAALARRLRREGKRVRVFKTGPDFLDPMLLERASGAPVYQLDLWMVGEAVCRRMIADAARDADVVLIEGVMGLYDGQPSSADLANAFGIPVLLALDASAMAQTAGALVLGLRDYGPVRLAGVIANRVGGEGHARMVADALRGVQLLGHLPRQERSLPERHLGIHQADEVAGLDGLLDGLADALHLSQDALDGITEIMLDATAAPPSEPMPHAPLRGKTIAIARDAAFAFLYRANLDCLEAMGASLAYFSPLRDEPVPAQADAVYLPGGYPELHARTLSHNRRWQTTLRVAHAAGLPVYAECGGMMAVADTLTDTEGREWPMAGLLPGKAIMQQRLAALGLQAWGTGAGELRGHTFHYSRFDTPAAPHAHARRHPAGTEGEAVYRAGSLTASYFHAWFPSCPEAVARLFTGGEA